MSSRDLQLIEGETKNFRGKYIQQAFLVPENSACNDLVEFMDAFREPVRDKINSVMRQHNPIKCSLVVHVVYQKAREEERRAVEDPAQLRAKNFIILQSLDFDRVCIFLCNDFYL